MGGVQIVIFLVRCGEGLLLCQDLPSEHLRFSSMDSCQAKLSAVIEEAAAPGANAPVVMGKCRYQLAETDRRRDLRIWQSARFQQFRYIVQETRLRIRE